MALAEGIGGFITSMLTVAAGRRARGRLLQRLSGVATLTARYVDAVRETKARIVDTRKTTPGLRALETAAVHLGGGTTTASG